MLQPERKPELPNILDEQLLILIFLKEKEPDLNLKIK